MADPLILNPTLTLAGQAAAFNAANTGIELILDAVSFGRAHYNPTGNELTLADPVGSRVPFAGGSRPTLYQLRISAAWDEDVGEVGIGEIGFWSGDTLVFIWSLANGTVASYKTDGVAYVLMADLGFAQVPAGSINLVIDSNVDAALAALSAHEGAANAHPQYLLRADVAKDAGPLMGLVHSAGSAANALLLKLDAPESKLPALAKFQRFQFVAVATNTGPVTVNIAGLGVKAVKRGGDTGLIELDAGDIKAGSLYDLNYDGASFQLGGGVGSGKAFERFAFKAALAQKDFAAPHVPGSIIVFRNGREIFDYVSAADGSKVTLTTACNMDEDVVIVALKSFKVADNYTKAEVEALIKTASGMPVGAMLPVPKGIVPPGYLELDGSVKSIATYPDLAAYLGTTFNKGDEGAGNFRLPDSRGEFLRGWDHGRGVDAGRAIGSWQADDNKAHTHGTMYEEIVDEFAAGSVRRTYVQQYSSLDNVNTKSSGGAEARPRNLAVMWCIKAWNTPVNQGNVDVAVLSQEVQKLRRNGPVVGDSRNAAITITAAATVATFTADQLVVEDSTGSYLLKNVNDSINLANVGVGGMDTGAAPTNGFLAIYEIFNPTSKTTGLLGRNATTAKANEVYDGQNMPAGYTASALVSVWRVSAGKLVVGYQEGRRIHTSWGPLLNDTTQKGTLTALSIAGYVPMNAKTLSGQLIASPAATGGVAMDVAGTIDGIGGKYYNAYLSAGSSGQAPFSDMPLIVPQTLYYIATSSSATAQFQVLASGYTF